MKIAGYLVLCLMVISCNDPKVDSKKESAKSNPALEQELTEIQSLQEELLSYRAGFESSMSISNIVTSAFDQIEVFQQARSLDDLARVANDEESDISRIEDLDKAISLHEKIIKKANLLLTREDLADPVRDEISQNLILVEESLDRLTLISMELKQYGNAKLSFIIMEAVLYKSAKIRFEVADDSSVEIILDRDRRIFPLNKKKNRIKSLRLFLSFAKTVVTLGNPEVIEVEINKVGAAKAALSELQSK